MAVIRKVEYPFHCVAPFLVRLEAQPRLAQRIRFGQNGPTMMTRLDTICPDIAGLLRSAAPEKRSKACLAACQIAVARSGVSGRAISVALDSLAQGAPVSSAERRELDQLAAQLDDEYLTAQEAADAHRTGDQSYVRTFWQARAAAALGFATSAPDFAAAADAIYEACAASDGLDAIATAVREALL